MINRGIQSVIGMLAIAMSTGCAFTPQTVKLAPTVQAKQSDVGRGRPLQLTVVDERPKSTAGTRGAMPGMGAAISFESDLAGVFRRSLEDGLKAHSFAPSATKTSDGKELRVEIRAIDYAVHQGIVTGKIRAECSLKAVCMNGANRGFERLYRGEGGEDVFFIPGAEANEKYLNTAVSSSVNALLEDSALLQCLAQ